MSDGSMNTLEDMFTSVSTVDDKFSAYNLCTQHEKELKEITISELKVG